jgi:hypothetical protein
MSNRNKRIRTPTRKRNNRLGKELRLKDEQ